MRSFLQSGLARLTVVACASDQTAPGPTDFASIVGKRYALTEIEGNSIPAVYYSSPDQSYDAWVDSAWVTFQPDTFVVITMYRTISGYGQPHTTDGTQSMQMTGRYTVSGDTILMYTNEYGPDTAILRPGSGIELRLASHYPNEVVPWRYWLCDSVARPYNPYPHITDVSPGMVVAGDDEFVLTVNGSSFLPGTYVTAGGSHLLPFSQSPTQMKVRVPAWIIMNPGNLAIRISNPTPGGGTSNAIVIPIASTTH